VLRAAGCGSRARQPWDGPPHGSVRVAPRRCRWAGTGARMPWSFMRRRSPAGCQSPGTV